MFRSEGLHRTSISRKAKWNRRVSQTSRVSKAWLTLRLYFKLLIAKFYFRILNVSYFPEFPRNIEHVLRGHCEKPRTLPCCVLVDLDTRITKKFSEFSTEMRDDKRISRRFIPPQASDSPSPWKRPSRILPAHKNGRD